MNEKIKRIINKKNKSKIICLTAYSKNIASEVDKHADIEVYRNLKNSVLKNADINISYNDRNLFSKTFLNYKTIILPNELAESSIFNVPYTSSVETCKKRNLFFNSVVNSLK